MALAKAAELLIDSFRAQRQKGRRRPLKGRKPRVLSYFIDCDCGRCLKLTWTKKKLKEIYQAFKMGGPEGDKRLNEIVKDMKILVVKMPEVKKDDDK